MNHVTELLRTPAMTLARFEHATHVPHRDPETEQSAGHALNFIEAGSFRVRVGGQWSRLTSHTTFVTTTGLEFSCAHDQDYPDDACLCVRYSDEAIESLRREGAPPDPPAIVRLTNRRQYLKRQLAGVSQGDEARGEAIAAALYWSLSPSPRRTTQLFRPHQLSWYASRLERIKALMDTHYAEPLSLSRLAAEAGMSVFHFARVFGELEGETPHRRLQRVRLTQARQRLSEGATVTDTCYGVGFGSLSHFISTYRRHFGVRPSDTARTGRVQEIRRPSF